MTAAALATAAPAAPAAAALAPAAALATAAPAAPAAARDRRQGATTLAGPPSRLQAAVDGAARHLYDAETALHIARQTGVGAWIGAAYDRLSEAIAGHTAAVGALEAVTAD